MDISRDELEANVASEAESDVILDELANKDGEITLEDLRQLPGSDKLSDEELMLAWNEANADPTSDESKDAQKDAAQAVADATGGQAVQTQRGWKVYDDKGVEVADLSKLSANDLLKHQFEYQANGKAHRKSIDDIMRVASYGHYNESKLSRMQAERDSFYKELTEARPQLNQMTQNTKLVSYALQQFHLGNDKPLSQLLDAVKQNMGAVPTNEAHASAPSAVDTATEAAGQRVWYENIQPAADQIATRYGAKQHEVRAAVQHLINQEPAETLTWDKINEIVNTEVPMLLERHGYNTGTAARQAAPASAQPAASAAPSDEVSTLKRQIAELQAKVTNSDTATIRARSRNLPPGSGGRSNADASNDGGEVPAAALKSAREFRNFLRNQ